MRTCPKDKKQLESTILYNTEVDYCPQCYGLFFEEDELRQAKDSKDNNLKWLDIDLWKDTKKFKVNLGIRICPECRLPLYEVYYGDSGVIVDVCNLCHGIWLDKGEFQKIIAYLKEKAGWQSLQKYAKNVVSEFWEVFVGPETLREEVEDFLIVLKVLNYKFAVQYPKITVLINTTTGLIH